jgi:transposase-like protein
LNEHLKRVLKLNLCLSRQEKINGCPICGHNKYIKYGFYDGIQRYKCKNKSCKRTFSLSTNFIWSYSKKSSEKWAEFIEFMLAKKTLRYCAEKLNINLGTAFYWRHKVLNGLRFHNIPENLYGNIHMGKAIMKENFKGCRNINAISRKDIWIVAAKGKSDSILSIPICKNGWDSKAFDEKIYNKIDKKSYIKAYGDRYLCAIANKHNLNSMKIEKEVEAKIRNFTGNVIRWFDCFRGIATKYLGDYLCWFIIFYRDKEFTNINLLYELAKDFSFINTEKIRFISEE